MSERHWTPGARVAWWLKFVVAVAAGVVSCAGAARVLGISIDLQSKTEARAQHEVMRQEIRDDREQSMQRLETKVDKINDRIDVLLTTLVRKRQPKE